MKELLKLVTKEDGSMEIISNDIYLNEIGLDCKDIEIIIDGMWTVLEKYFKFEE
jgi:hypothetical protein